MSPEAEALDQWCRDVIRSERSKRAKALVASMMTWTILFEIRLLLLTWISPFDGGAVGRYPSDRVVLAPAAARSAGIQRPS